jgi:uncharacterized protein YjbI with pentapeptide repeats
MASAEQLQRLKRNVKAWNEWRVRSYDVAIDLSGADLRETNLRETNLSGANLSGADLSRANLSGANLRGANLSGARLFAADLSDAYLSSARLSSALLGKADLSNANLFAADLSEANLRGANLSGANLGETDLSGADLREADLSGADLNRANLSRALLSELDLNKVDLRETNVGGAYFGGVAYAQIAGFHRVETPERYEIEVEIALPQEDINYPDLERLQMAIDHLMEVCEFELKGELDPVRGSWWQKLIFWSKDKTTSTAVNRILQTLKEVFVARSIGIPSAEEAAKLAEAVDKVIKSLEPFENGVIRLGKLLVIKGNLRGKSVLRVETISLALAQKLADNPQLINRPEQLLLLIEEPDTASQGVPTVTPSDKPQGHLPPAESVLQLPPGGNP